MEYYGIKHWEIFIDEPQKNHTSELDTISLLKNLKVLGTWVFVTYMLLNMHWFI